MNRLLLLLSILSLSAMTVFTQPFAYLANFSGDDVSVVDLNTNTVIATIAVGNNPVGVLTNNTNRKVYVTNQESSTLSVIDGNTNTVEATINVGTRPLGMALTADGSRLYVASQDDNNVHVINTTDNTLITIIDSGGAGTTFVALSPDENQLYLANDLSGSLTIVDATTNTISRTIAVGERPIQVVFNAEGTKAYVTNFNSDNISVIDVATAAVSNTIATGDGAYGMTIGAAGSDKLYVSNFLAGTISVINMNTETVETNISLDVGPTGMSMSNDGSTLYVAGFNTDDLSFIDVSTNMPTGDTIAVGTSPIALGNFILGESNSALDFDGADDRVVIPHENLLDNLTEDYTISAWVKIDNNTVGHPVFHASTSLSNGADDGLLLSANVPALGNRPLFQIRQNTGTVQNVIGNEALSTDTWHHIVFSYVAATITGTLYVDGAEARSNNEITILPSTISSSLGSATLGFSPFAVGEGGGYFSGQIDEFRITSSASNCFAINQQNACQLPDNTPDLEVYYRFNQGLVAGDNTDITALVATAGPNGTLQNFALVGQNSNFIGGSPVSSSTTCSEVFEPSLTVTYSMNSSTIMDDDTTPSTDDGTDLGDVPAGGMASSTFTLTNGGTGDLGITNVMSSNQLFNVNYAAPDLTVTFSPDAVCTQSSTITFQHDDCTIGPDFTFAVQGNGVPPPVELMLTQTAVCANAGLQTGLGGGTPTGGVYSGTGVTDDGNGMTFSFDPTTAGTGDITITYTVNDSDATGTITVIVAPMVTFSTGGLSVAVAAGVQTGLGGGMPAGGVYSGDGVTDDGNGMTYSFDPAAAGEGENIITYTFTNANSCSEEQDAILSVTAATLPGEECDIAIDINNLFGQAAMVPQASDTYDNYADYDTNDTDIVPSCFLSLQPVTGTIWFSFTGDGNHYTINSANNSSNNELGGIVYTGPCDMRTELSCNVTIGQPNFSIDLQTEVGVEYTIMVAEASANQTASFNLEVTNQSTIGVQDIRNTAFNIYPNPTNGWVQLDGFTADHIEVLDQLGRTVRTQAQAGNGVDLAGLPAGVYVLLMQAEDEVISAKVVKE